MNHQLPDIPDPAVAERDLPPGRHRLLKERLMTEILRDGHESPPVRRRKPRLRPLFVAAAVTAVAAVTFTLLPSSGGDAAPRVRTAAAVLEDAALAAEHTAGYGTVRGDQFVYVENKTAPEGVAKAGSCVAASQREKSWVSVDGSRPGLRRFPGYRDLPIEGKRPGDRHYDTYPGYDHMKSLPTGADAMYDWLRAVAPGRVFHIFPKAKSFPREGLAELEKDQAVFDLVGDMFAQAIVPPQQGAAFYRAVARVPGVTVTENAVDCLGRHGIAIARQDAGATLRTEWILDAKTYAFLGERRTLTEDRFGMKKGTVLRDTAVVRRAVVDKVGERP
ncbi:CU044_5270 family protein [Streptomyces sp. NPDC002491]